MFSKEETIDVRKYMLTQQYILSTIKSQIYNYKLYSIFTNEYGNKLKM